MYSTAVLQKGEVDTIDCCYVMGCCAVLSSIACKFMCPFLFLRTRTRARQSRFALVFRFSTVLKSKSCLLILMQTRKLKTVHEILPLHQAK